MATTKPTIFKSRVQLIGVNSRLIKVSSRRISQVSGGEWAWYTTKKSVQYALSSTENGEQGKPEVLLLRAPFGWTVSVAFGRRNNGLYAIGCAQFSRKTFRAIMRRLGVTLG